MTPHKMGMQVPCRVDPEVPEEKIVFRFTHEAWRSIHSLAEQKECKILKGHLRLDHVHMLVSISPKLSVSSVVGFIKGKSAIYIARNFAGKRRNFVGENFWARGYYVSTVGLDEAMVRSYIKHQEKRRPTAGPVTVVVR